MQFFPFLTLIGEEILHWRKCYTNRGGNFTLEELYTNRGWNFTPEEIWHWFYMPECLQDAPGLTILPPNIFRSWRLWVWVQPGLLSQPGLLARGEWVSEWVSPGADSKECNPMRRWPPSGLRPKKRSRYLVSLCQTLNRPVWALLPPCKNRNRLSWLLVYRMSTSEYRGPLVQDTRWPVQVTRMSKYISLF